MNDLEHLQEVLKSSVEKNGEQPLTNKWLLNIVKMAIEKKYRDEEKSDVEYDPHWD